MSEPTFEVSPQDDMPLVSRPYTERQRIVVVDDALAQAEREAKQQGAAVPATTAEKGVDWRTALEIGGRKASRKRAEWRKALRVDVDDRRKTSGFAGALGAAIGIASVPVAAVGAVPALVGAGAALGVRELNKLRKVDSLRDKGVDVLTVARSEAKSLTFPAGHPRDEVLYVGHPAAPTKYYPAAQFHRLTFEDKLSEAVRMLMSLGAVQMKVEHVKGWSTEFSSTFNVPLGVPEVEVGAEAGSAKKSRSQILFEATLDGTETPSLPEDLAWYPYESTWQLIAEGRLKRHLKDFSLAVVYEDDFGVNAGLELAVSEIGLNMGGKFEDYQSTVWRIIGAFG